MKMNMIKKTVLALVVFFVCNATNIFGQTDTVSLQKLTLQQCLQIALQQNDNVQHQEINSGIAKNNLQGAKGYMIPTLNGDITHGINTGRNIDPYTNTYANQTIRFGNYGLNSSLTIFNAFAVQNNIKQNKLAYEASRFEVQNEKDVIALQVILAYLQVLTNEDLLAVANQQAQVSAKQVDRLNILNNDGAISPDELYDLKGEYAGNQLTLADAASNLETAKITLAGLLNIPYNKDMEVERLSLSDMSENTFASTDSIYQSALKNLAVIKAADLRNKSAVYGVKSYRSQSYPSLYINGGLFTNYSSNASTQQYLGTTDIETNSYVLNGADKLPLYVQQDNYQSQKIKYKDQISNNFNSSISIGISIPILNNFRNKTQIKTALLQQKDAEITLKTTKTRLQQNVEQAYTNVTSAQKRYDALTDQVNAYKESFRVAEIKFNAGVITSVDYLIAKNKVDQSDLNLVIAKYDYVLRSMVLNYYSGRLTF
jgi:outer membrane protein